MRNQDLTFVVAALCFMAIIITISVRYKLHCRNKHAERLHVTTCNVATSTSCREAYVCHNTGGTMSLLDIILLQRLLDICIHHSICNDFYQILSLLSLDHYVSVSSKNCLSSTPSSIFSLPVSWGTAHFVADLPLQPKTLFAVPVLADRVALLQGIDASECLEVSGVHSFISAADVKEVGRTLRSHQ